GASSSGAGDAATPSGAGWGSIGWLLVQVAESLGDVPEGVVVGSDLVVVLLGFGELAERLVDPAQVVIQGIEQRLVVRLGGFQGVLEAALGQLGVAIGLEGQPDLEQGLDSELGAGAGLLEFGNRRAVLAVADQQQPELEMEVEVFGVQLQAAPG